MKRRVAVLIILLVFSLPVAALATDVGGPILIDTTWTLAGSPYTFQIEVAASIPYFYPFSIET